MKKKLMFLFLIMFIIPFIETRAGSLDSTMYWDSYDDVYSHQYKDGRDMINKLVMLKINGKSVYCATPGIKVVNGTVYSSTNNIYETNISNINKKRVNLISYFGYGYENHNSREYYMATQELIWREVDYADVWWTDRKTDGNIINIDYYKNEILSLVNSYELAPSFDFSNKYVLGDEITVKDANNVLKYYYTDNKNISIDGNELKIKLVDTNNKFTLYKRSAGLGDNIYYRDGFQTLVNFDYTYDFSKEYEVLANYGEIILNKYDYETKDNYSKNSNVSLENATYGLFDSNMNLIEERVTDKEGKLIFDNLVYGKYYVKEIKPSKGYMIDENIYEVMIDSQCYSKEIISYEKIIDNIINIVKVLNDTNINAMVPEENIEFGVYDSNNNLYSKYTTDINGKISFILPYGTYILKQLTVPEGILKVSDRTIIVDEEKNIQDITLVNEYEKLPDTGKKLGISKYIIIQIILIGIYLYDKKIYRLNKDH